MAEQAGAYRRLLGLLEAQRRNALSESGFSLGQQVVKEEQEISEIQSNIDKELRRIERASKKRGKRKSLGSLLGGALGFALAGPLGIASVGLASGLGAFAGSRLAGQKKIRGLDPNLTLRENQEFYKQKGEDLDAVAEDISKQLSDMKQDELLPDILQAIAVGSTAGKLKELDLGKKVTDVINRLTGKTSSVLTDSQTALGNIMPDVTGSLEQGTLGTSYKPAISTPERFTSQYIDDAFSLSKTPTTLNDKVQNLFKLETPTITGSMKANVMAPGSGTFLDEGLLKQSLQNNIPSKQFNYGSLIEAPGSELGFVPDTESFINKFIPTTETLEKPGLPYGGADLRKLFEMAGEPNYFGGEDFLEDLLLDGLDESPYFTSDGKIKPGALLRFLFKNNNTTYPGTYYGTRID